MKIAIVGSRDFKDLETLRNILKDLPKEFGRFTFISGGARGVDTLTEKIIDKMNAGKFSEHQHHPKLIFKPDWDTYGKKAGFLRNQKIVQEADMLIAFWDGKSKGTKHSIDLAVQKGIPINIYIRAGESK